VGELYALDIETTGLDRFTDKILVIGLWSPKASKSFATASEFVEWCRLQSDCPEFVTHRGSFDFNFIRQHSGADLSHCWGFDTHSISSILIPGPGLALGQKRELGLENLAIQLLGQEPYKLDRENLATKYTTQEIESYCLKDCQLTYELFEKLKSQFDPRSWSFVAKWLMPATKFCTQLEWDGICIDAEGLSKYALTVQEERTQVLIELNEISKHALIYYTHLQREQVKQHYREMYEKAKTKAKNQTKCAARYATLAELALSKVEPFNWNSPEQLKWLLRDYYCLDIHNDREDKETTNEAMLRSLDHPVSQKLVEYREVEKLVSTCIPALLENLSENKTVHANYLVGGTRTGRLSSSGPNLQQIPKGPIRSYVRAAHTPNILLTIDYAQIEVRILAAIANETELIDAFKRKIDPYSVIAQKLLKVDAPLEKLKELFPKERNVSKTAGLSILYGTGPAKLQEVLKKELSKDYSLGECRSFINSYRESLPGVKRLRSQLDRQLANGKIAYNLLGRPFHIASNDDIYMKGLNTLIQGSASDLVLWSQTEFVIPLLKELEVDFTHRMIIHDEVVIELPADIAETLTQEAIIPAMTTQIEQALNLTVPLAVEYNISKSWTKP
jgi:DNA polymerase I-like protein with 3'-5' exonuclease and polymerase domains